MVVFSFFHVGRVKRYPFLFLRWFSNNLFLNYFTTGELYIYEKIAYYQLF